MGGNLAFAADGQTIAAICNQYEPSRTDARTTQVMFWDVFRGNSSIHSTLDGASLHSPSARMDDWQQAVTTGRSTSGTGESVRMFRAWEAHQLWF